MDNPPVGNEDSAAPLGDAIANSVPTEPTAATDDGADFKQIHDSMYKQRLQEMTQGTDPLAIDVGRGFANAIPHLTSSVLSTAADITSPITGISGDDTPDWEPFGKTTTLTGGIAQNLTEFTIGMMASGGVLKTLGVAGQLQKLKYGKAALHTVEGAMTDFTLFGAHQERMSDLLYNLGDGNPLFHNAVTKFLKSDESDSWFMGRLKNVLEGAGLASATSAIFKVFKAKKAIDALAKTHGDEAAAKLWAETTEKLKPELDAVFRGDADLIGVTEDHAKEILIRTGKITPEQADAAILGLKSVASEKGVDLMTLLKDDIQAVRSRTAQSYNAEAAMMEDAIGRHVDFEGAKADAVARAEQAAGQSTSATPSQLKQSLDAVTVGTIQPNKLKNEVQNAVKNAHKFETQRLFQSVDEPPIPKGTTRLYRAETGGGGTAGPAMDWLKTHPEFKAMQDASGRWFYSTREEAEAFAKDFGADHVSYVDVPESSFEGYRVSNQPDRAKFAAAGRDKEEFFVPREVADKRAPLLQDNPNRLFDSMQADPNVHKGVTDFLNTGKAVVTLFEKADGSTFIHEVSHILRRHLPEDELRKVAEVFGVKDASAWSRAEEEQFAKAVTDKVLTGKSLSPAIDAILDRTGKNVAGIYKNIRASSFGDKVSPALKKFAEDEGKFTNVADRPVLTTTEPSDLKKAGQVIADAMTKGDDFSKTLDDNGINLFHVDSSDDVRKLMGSISNFVESYTPSLTKVEHQADVLKQATKAAAEYGMNVDQYVAGIKEVTGQTKDLSKAIMKSRLLMHTVVSHFDEVTRAASESRTPENAAKFLQSWNLVQQATILHRESQQSVARALGSFRQNVGVLDKVAAMQEVLNKGGPDKVWGLVDEVNRINAVTPSGERTIAKRKLMEPSKFWGVINELRINSMLSSLPGMGADVVSNAAKTVSMPFETALAKASLGDLAGVKDALSTYKALGNQIYSAWKSAWGAFKLGDTIVDARPELPSNHFITASTFGQQGTGIGAGIDLLGNIARMPSRLRMAGDEFFKELNYRAFLETKLSGDAAAQGLSGAAADAFVQNGFREAFDELGRGVVTDALDYARKATFATPLDYGTIGGKALMIANQHPALRLIVPFIKTPVNIFSDVMGHTPLLGLAIKEQRQALFRNGLNSPEGREVLAKWALGGLFFSGAQYGFQSGSLTGRGSDDPKERERMKLDGWQPYSIAYTGSDGKKKYVAYNRIEPWGSLLGMAADYAEVAPHLADGEINKAVTAMLVSFSRNATNKTYVKGLAEFMDALSSPEKNMENYVASMGGSFMPSGLRMFSNDPYQREAKSFLDGLRRKVPGLSENLPPKRNILGEPIPVTKAALLPDSISPFAFSESVDDPVKTELARLHGGIDNPPSKRYGVDYSAFQNAKGQTAYDRWLELVGQIKDEEGKGISQSLKAAIKSREYQQLIKAGEAGEPFRVKTVGQILNAYRTTAEEKMLNEFPAVKAAVRQGRSKQASDLFNALQQMQSAANQ